MFSKERLSRRKVLQTVFWTTAICGSGRGILGVPVIGRITYDEQAGRMRVRLSDFPELLETNGSVRLSPGGVAVDGQRSGVFYPVIINRLASGQFVVLSANCTHAGYVVQRLGIEDGVPMLRCPGHGSRFRPDGEVIEPSEANAPLPQLHYTIVQGVMDIQMPEIQFYAVEWNLASGAGSRAAVKVLTFGEARYEVWRQDDLNQAAVRASFSRTPSGPLSEQVAQGNDDYQTFYLERPAERSFYQIVMQAREV